MNKNDKTQHFLEQIWLAKYEYSCQSFQQQWWCSVKSFQSFTYYGLNSWRTLCSCFPCKHYIIITSLCQSVLQNRQNPPCNIFLSSKFSVNIWGFFLFSFLKAKSRGSRFLPKFTPTWPDSALWHSCSSAEYRRVPVDHSKTWILWRSDCPPALLGVSRSHLDMHYIRQACINIF